MPGGEDRDWAENTIARLAGRFGTTPFDPHMTIYSGTFSMEDEFKTLRRTLIKFAAEKGPIKINVKGLEVSAEYFKTLFITFEEQTELQRLHDMAKEAMNRELGYKLMPHLSLLYADISLEEKQSAADCLALQGQSMLLDEVRIISPDPHNGWRDTRSWKTLFRKRLGRKADGIQAILFDYGGVLAEEGFRNGLFELARRQGLDPETVSRAGREGVHDSGYVIGRGTESRFWQLMREKTGLKGSDGNLSETILNHFILRPRMLNFVRSLRGQGYMTAIVSDQTDWLDRLDRRDGFFLEFDSVFNSYHIGKSKRDPSVFDAVAEQLGIAPEEALFIDDTSANVARAKERGMRGIVFDDEERVLRKLEEILGQDRR